MELVLFKRYYEGKYPREQVVKAEFPGEGTVEDPVVINSTERLPSNFTYRDSNLHIIINECNFRKDEYGIIFKNCSNLEIINCQFRDVLFLECSNSHVSNSNIIGIYLTESHDILITDSEIKGLYLNVSYKNQVKNCTIEKVVNKSSRSNLFEGNIIPEKYVKKILEASPTKRKLRKAIPFSIIGILVTLILIFMTIQIFNRTLDLFGLFVLLVLTVILLMPIMIYAILTSKYRKHAKELKEEELPNKVI